MPHYDALVIALELGGTAFSKIFIETGYATNVLSQKIPWSIRHPNPIVDHEVTPLISVGGNTVQPLGTVSIVVKAYDLELKTEFAVAYHFVLYDAILGRPWLREMKDVPRSTTSV